MDIQAFFDEPTNTVSYVVSDESSKDCVIIDPVLGYDQASGRTDHGSADQIIAYVNEHGFNNRWILETHVHADHLTAAPYLKKALCGKVGIGKHVTRVQQFFGELFHAEPAFVADGSQFDVLFDDGDRLPFGAAGIDVMFTPGHTPACVTYVVGDAAFVGDTLFMPDFGTARTDFPGGDAAQLYQSIQRILALPEKTRLFLCHDYKAPGRDEYVWETTVAAQLASNVHIKQGTAEPDFVAFREQRDATLRVPRLLLPSIQVNMRGGHFPPAESNGVSYLKVPLNQL